MARSKPVARMTASGPAPRKQLARCGRGTKFQPQQQQQQQQVSIQILKKPKCKPNLAEKELLPLSTEGPGWKVLV